MGLITNILYPVNFSPSCVAMAAYVKGLQLCLGPGFQWFMLSILPSITVSSFT
jgi:hypothetical protein